MSVYIKALPPLIVPLSPPDRHLWFHSKNTSNFRADFLPGLLERNWHVVNWVDRSLFYSRDNPPVHAVPLEEMFDEIIPLANEEEGTDDASTWSLDEWYCTECLDGLFKEHFWKWMLARQRKGASRNSHKHNVCSGCSWPFADGEPVKPDCWYGYNCRTMTHRDQHAQKLNVSSHTLELTTQDTLICVIQHICVPTRGDGAPAA